jgi:hypothetical protein
MTATAFVPSAVAAVRAASATQRGLAMLPPALSLGGADWSSSTVASSLLLSDDMTAAATSFEPILPDTTTLVGMGVIIGLCVIASSVWSNEVVPVSRSKLAISKSRGEVKEYLDELKEDDTNERGVEQWLFTDWLQDNKSQKAPAIPLLKKAKWNSGDNPVVVTSAMMLVGVVVASLTERIFQ